MANIQQVRYPVPQQAPWAQALQGAVGGAMSGMSGYYGRRQQEQKNLMSLLPVLAQMKMLTPGGSDIKVPGTGLSFGVGSPATDYGELENKMQATQKGMDIGAVPMTKAYAKFKALQDVDAALKNDTAYMFMSMSDPKGASALRAQKVSEREQEYLQYVPEEKAKETPNVLKKSTKIEEEIISRKDWKKNPKDSKGNPKYIQPMVDSDNPNRVKVQINPAYQTKTKEALSPKERSDKGANAAKTAAWTAAALANPASRKALGKYGGAVLSKLPGLAGSAAGLAGNAAMPALGGWEAGRFLGNRAFGTDTTLDQRMEDWYSKNTIPAWRKLMGNPQYQGFDMRQFGQY